MKKIIAHFIGKEGSLGFKHKKTYVLILEESNNEVHISTKEGLNCTYGSFIKFLDNWTDIFLTLLELCLCNIVYRGRFGFSKPVTNLIK